jgi:hypothetical protein
MFSVACGESDGDDGATTDAASSEGTASTTAPTSSTDPTTTASSTETMSTTDSTTATTTSASTTTADTEDDSTTKSDDTSTTSDSDDTSAKPCGDGMCGADEVCVNPCCGGPAPGCEDSDANGQCPNGQEPTPADQCGNGCNTLVCCPMAPCMADPPFCAGKADLQCHETQCSLDECFGTLQDDQLSCECA